MPRRNHEQEKQIHEEQVDDRNACSSRASSNVQKGQQRPQIRIILEA